MWNIRFFYGLYGKPELADTPGGGMLRFNVSHSRGLALYTFTRNRKIGVDLESIRSVSDIVGIAGHFFSAHENVVLRTLPSAKKQEAFFTCWVRKEAYIKARGDGLSLALNQFDVSLASGEPAALLQTRGDPPEACHWSLHDLVPCPGYVAALCVEGDNMQLTCWRYPEQVC